MVSFKSTVSVREYRRLLDGGGTVPGDGSSVTLGLGRLVAKSIAPLLHDRPPSQRPIEERSWMPSSKRVRMLRQSMGDNVFFGLWARRRWEVARIKRSRKRCNSDDTDCAMMPESSGEAEGRAAALHEEVVRSSRREPPQRARAVSRAITILASPPKTCRSPRKSQRLCKEVEFSELPAEPQSSVDSKTLAVPEEATDERAPPAKRQWAAKGA